LKKETLLAVNNLVVEFHIDRRTKIHAVSDASFDIGSGETLGLVGESGCGKSTVARSIVRLQNPTAGEILYDGKDLLHCSDEQLRKVRPDLQMIFQDATASLNPGRKIGKSVEEPLRVLGKMDSNHRFQRAGEIMQAVGLDPQRMYDRYPFEFSGGQCQRVALARALIMKPRFLICDEPVSSLDVSVQAQILNLLEKMKRRFNLTMLFISHDLAVVKNISDRVAVMYLGKICEIAPAEELYQSPQHPYSDTLLASIPEPDPVQQRKKVTLKNSEMPSPVSPPPGCRFHTRCPRSQDVCSESEPELTANKEYRQVACHFPL